MLPKIWPWIYSVTTKTEITRKLQNSERYFRHCPYCCASAGVYIHPRSGGKKNVAISRVNFHWIRRVRPCLSFAGRFVKNKLLCYHATRLVSFFSLLLVKILKTSNKDSNEAASIDPFRWLCVIKIRFTLKSQISDTISLSQ